MKYSHHIWYLLMLFPCSKLLFKNAKWFTRAFIICTGWSLWFVSFYQYKNIWTIASFVVCIERLHHITDFSPFITVGNVLIWWGKHWYLFWAGFYSPNISKTGSVRWWFCYTDHLCVRMAVTKDHDRLTAQSPNIEIKSPTCHLLDVPGSRGL